MIKLFQFPAGAFGVPNPSPFCIKVETWLRLAKLPYEVVPVAVPRRAPLGKLPYIEDGDARIPDSSAIIEHLTAAYPVTLDVGLSAQQRAIAHAFDRMFGEATYWGLVYARWVDAEGWEQMKTAFSFLPAVLRPLVPPLIRRRVQGTLHAQGMGRYQPEVIDARVAEDLAATAAQLGEQAFFLGDTPRSIDATVYAFIASIWEANIATRLKPLVAEHANLLRYSARMRAHCFPELPTLST